MVEDFVIDEGRFGPRLSVHGPWSDRMTKMVDQLGIQEIILNYARFWPDDHVGFLRETLNIRALTVLKWDIQDLRPIEELRQLRYLNLITDSKTKIDFDSFPKLEECVLEWSGAVTGALHLKGLRRLSINRLPKAKVELIAEMTELRHLGLLSCGAESLECFRSLTKLETVRLALFSKLADNAFLTSLTGLRELWIQSSRGFESLEPLRVLKHLQIITLDNCGPFESLEPLRSLNTLEHLVLMGPKKRVLDNDYSYVENLPKLNRYFR